MIRLPAIAVPLDTTEAEWPRFAAQALRVPTGAIISCRICRRSVDARKKDAVRLALTLDVRVQGDEAAILSRAKHPQAKIIEDTLPAAVHISALEKPPRLRPVVIGCGPAGLFAALTLAQAGAAPIVLERGQDALTRKRAVDAFWQAGKLDPDSNVQFGEGGAGTFSDGKLTTGIKDPRCAHVLQTFVRHGAPEEILFQAKPHIGTDHLLRIVQAMRGEIESLGGTVRFGARMTGLSVENGALRGVQVGGEFIETDQALLCIGHSARDTFAMLRDAGVLLTPKPFSIGVRVEHPQALIDRAQYGRFAGHPALGAAEYKLSARLANGRGVYTFCMCPGGVVVAAASEPGGVVVNGMSYFARDGANANSAVLVDVRPEDLAQDGPLSGIAFQRRWESLAFAAGGGGFCAPAQRMEDFLAGRPSHGFGGVAPSYRPGTVPADLHACLPTFVTDSLREALPRLDRQLKGFAHPDAVLTGVETRSSCPLRIPRDDRGEASVGGLFPVGEGAGYAGGIMSAAVDGIRAAQHALSLQNDSSRRSPT